jgi:virulence-associated protein VagC
MNARIPASVLQSVTQKDSTVFTSGNSQAIRIPKEFQFKTKQVKIIRRGDELIIKPKYLTGAEILANLPPLDPNENDDFDLAKIIRESNAKLPPERDLSHLFADTSEPPRSSTTSRARPAVKKKTSATKAKATR